MGGLSARAFPPYFEFGGIMAAVYTILSQDRTDQGKRVINAQIAFSSESYSSGLSLDRGQLGLPNVIESLSVYDQGGGFAPRYDGKIRLYQQGSGAGALTEVSGAQTVTVKVIAIGW